MIIFKVPSKRLNNFSCLLINKVEIEPQNKLLEFQGKVYHYNRYLTSKAFSYRCKYASSCPILLKTFFKAPKASKQISRSPSKVLVLKLSMKARKR